MSRLHTWFLSLTVLCVSAPLRAQDAPATAATPSSDQAPAGPGEAPSMSEEDARARVHFHAGTDYFERGDYENALRELEIAHEMSGRSEMYFNIGSCLERLGRLTEAADRFEQFLATGDRPNALAMRERIARLRARAAAASSETAPETAPETTSDTEAQPEPVTVPVTSSSGRTPHVASWITLGLGGAGLVAFGVLGGLALAEDGALASSCGTSCPPSRVSGLETLTIGADVSLVAGLVLAATGVVLVLTTDDGGDAAAGTITLGPGTLRASF